MAIKVELGSLGEYRRLVSWETCTACGLSEFRNRVVLGRGQIPARLLLVGEAPGKDENRQGYAFVGRAGDILDAALGDSGLDKIPYFITNIVACRPCDGYGMPNRAPSAVEIGECEIRLRSTVKLIKPEAVIAMGKTAQHWFPYELCRGRITAVPHPAYLLRLGGKKSPIYNQFVASLVEVRECLEKR